MGSRREAVTLIALAVVCLAITPQFVVAGDSEPEKGLLDQIRSLKPQVGKGIDLDVKVENPTGGTNEPAGAKRFLIKAAKSGYLTALYVSSEGKPFVIFPEGESAATQLESGKEYVFRSQDCNAAGGDKAQKGKVVFIVTARPWDMRGLVEETLPPGKTLTGAVSARGGLLAEKLREMAADDGFNKTVLDLEGRRPGLKMMGLPSAAKSKRPEEVVGTQGREDDQTKESGR